VVNDESEMPIEGEDRTEPEKDARQIRIDASVDLPPGSEFHLTLRYRPDQKSAYRTTEVNIAGADVPVKKHLAINLDRLPSAAHWYDQILRLIKTLSLRFDSSLWLFVGALLVYYLLRLIHLADFPIFFFTDEAVHTMLAYDLVKSGFVGLSGEFLPTFFKSGSTFNAGFPVYLQVLPVVLGIRSVFTTRFISASVTLLAAAGIGLIYEKIYNNRRGWLAVLVLSIIPAWFYHSRTAFETVEAVSFYTIFLLGYIRYRNGEFRWLYVSLVSAAMAFYSYSPARVVMAVMAVLLLISDARFHWENRKQLWKPFLLGLLLALPYFRFLYLHPGENQHHLEMLDSYWISSNPLIWKLGEFGKAYLAGLNPFYWFLPNEIDLSRHIMKNMGHLGWYFLPFFIGGLLISIKKLKNTNYRVMLFALLAAPTGAAVAAIGITRGMFMVIPAAFFITIGIDYCIDWLNRKIKIKWSLDLIVFTVLVLINFIFLDNVLTNGPVWFPSYGMEGMQYGGVQAFSRIKEILKEDPSTPIVFSPDWANGTDVLARFHMGDPVPIELASLNAYIEQYRPFKENTIFVMPPDDFNKVINSGKFEPMNVIDVINYPDGSPGFIFAHLKYIPSIKEVFEKEKSNRAMLSAAQIKINGWDAKVAYSRLDMGNIENLFDNNPATLIRSETANPLVLEVNFSHPQSIQSVIFRIGGSATQFSVYAQSENSDTPDVYRLSVRDIPKIRQIELPLKSKGMYTRMRFEVRTIFDGEPAHVHLWDLGFK